MKKLILKQETLRNLLSTPKDGMPFPTSWRYCLVGSKDGQPYPTSIGCLTGKN